MDNVKNNSYYLGKTKDNLQFVCKHMENISKEQFTNNELLQDSMSFRLIQISEDSKKLTDAFKNERSDIPWNDIVGLRNRIVHDYGNIDFTIVYDTLKNDIPEVLRMIEDKI